MSTTPTLRALTALHEAHALLMAAITAHQVPPGPLLHAAVEVADAVETLEAEAIEAAAEALRALWPPHRVRPMLRHAVQEGALTTSEIAAWTAAQSGGSGLEAQAALDALLDAVQAQERALAEAEDERGESL